MIIYDISRPLREGIAVWPGDQAFKSRWGMRILKGDSCNVSSVTMSVHTGTHLDAPYHFEEAGSDIGRVDLSPYLGPARLFSVPKDLPAITADLLRGLSWEGVERALFCTHAAEGEDDRFETRFVFLADDGAEFLAQRGLWLVGTDAPSVDAFRSKTMDCHRILQRGGVAILEGACLAHVPPGDYELICLPLKLDGLDGSPVRAILRQPD
jgi:arylformamidase